ncbi:MAG: hypothetical protein SGPRY_011939 [Prymnesium sp.]
MAFYSCDDDRDATRIRNLELSLSDTRGEAASKRKASRTSVSVRSFNRALALGEAPAEVPLLLPLEQGGSVRTSVQLRQLGKPSDLREQLQRAAAAVEQELPNTVSFEILRADGLVERINPCTTIEMIRSARAVTVLREEKSTVGVGELERAASTSRDDMNEENPLTRGYN